MDKLRVLKEGGKDTKIFGAVGEIGDVHQFCDFVERNIYLYNLVRPIRRPLASNASRSMASRARRKMGSG